MRQIAELAGVSIATVSKVLNGKDERISLATRQRIAEIIKEEGYVANRVASSMVTKQTKTLGLVIPDIANPFFPDLARGVEDGANKAGYTLILCNSDNSPQKEASYLAMLREKMVDGIILTASGKGTNFTEAFRHLHTPVVCVDRDIDGVPLDGEISVDNKAGAFAAVAYLLNKGYRRIIHLSGQMTARTAIDRYQGYLQAHQAAGIEPIANHLLAGSYDAAWGYQGVRILLEAGESFDSLFCGNDLIALGAYKALHQAGLKIPDDVGVMGFDDIYMAQIVTPELTTVRQPAYAMGFKAVELLVKRLGGAREGASPVVLPTELVLRGSTR